MGALIGKLLPVVLGRVLDRSKARGLNEPEPKRYSRTMQGVHGMIVALVVALLPDMDEGLVQEGVAGALALAGLLRAAYGRYMADE